MTQFKGYSKKWTKDFVFKTWKFIQKTQEEKDRKKIPKNLITVPKNTGFDPPDFWLFPYGPAKNPGLIWERSKNGSVDYGTVIRAVFLKGNHQYSSIGRAERLGRHGLRRQFKQNCLDKHCVFLINPWFLHRKVGPYGRAERLGRHGLQRQFNQICFNKRLVVLVI